MDITELLAFSAKEGATDLHISAGLPPIIRIDSDVRRINLPPMEHRQVHSLIYEIMNDKQRRDFEEFLETDFSFDVPGIDAFVSMSSIKIVAQQRFFELFHRKFSPSSSSAWEISLRSYR